MEALKNVLKFFGNILYSAFIGFVLFVIAWYAVPIVVKGGWWMIIFLYVLAAPIVIGIFGALSGTILSPIMILGERSESKIVPTIILLWTLYSCCKLAWVVNINYATPNYILAVTVNLFFAYIIIVFIIGLWSHGKEE